jgi:hypothetical protein
LTGGLVKNTDCTKPQKGQKDRIQRGALFPSALPIEKKNSLTRGIKFNQELLDPMGH